MAQATYKFFTGICDDAQHAHHYNFININVHQPGKPDTKFKQKVQTSTIGKYVHVWNSGLVGESGTISVGFKNREGSPEDIPMCESTYVRLTSSQPCSFYIHRKGNKWEIKIKETKFPYNPEDPPEVNVTVGDDGEGG